jgi:hypothetical protein
MVQKLDATEVRDDPAHPTWFRSFLRVFNQLVVSLHRSQTNRDFFPEKVRFFQTTQVARHAEKLALSHDLSNPGGVCLVAGRVAAFTYDATKNLVTVKVYLPSTPLIDPEQGTSAASVRVADPSFFQVGDTVLFGQQQRVIVGIKGSQVILNTPVPFNDCYSMALYQTKITVTFF